MTEKDAGAPVPMTNEDREERPRVRLLAVLVIGLAALVLRLGFVLSGEARMEFPDEAQYMNIAGNYANGQGLSVSVDGHGNVLEPNETMQRPPIYPLMLAVIVRFDPDTGAVRAAQVVQAVLGALTCIMIYVLARELTDEGAAWIAGGIAAVYPFFVYFTGRVLSETLFLLLFVTSWYFIVRMWKDLNARAGVTWWLGWCLVGGFLAAGATLTRSSVLPVYLMVPGVMLLLGPRRLMGFALGLLLVFVLFVGLSPWAARNWVHVKAATKEGGIVLTTCKVGESLYEAVGPRATGGPNKENTVWPEEVSAMRHDEYARNQYLLWRSLRYMRNNTKRTVRLAGVKFLRTWNVIPNYEAARTPLYITISLISYVPVLLTGILGLFLCMKRPQTVVWLMVPIVVFTLIHMIFVGSVRYRLAMMPFVMTFSGVTLWRLFCGWFKPTCVKVEEQN